MLEESARAFNQIDFSDMTRVEMFEFVTGKEITETKWGDQLLNAKELIFIPNAHIGPYIRTAKVGDNFYIYFGAHLPEGSDIRVPELDRAEIVSRISALADDTRLQILQLIAEKGEMRSQEIMEADQLEPAQCVALPVTTDSSWIFTGKESKRSQSIYSQRRSH